MLWNAHLMSYILTVFWIHTFWMYTHTFDTTNITENKPQQLKLKYWIGLKPVKMIFLILISIVWEQTTKAKEKWTGIRYLEILYTGNYSSQRWNNGESISGPYVTTCQAMLWWNHYHHHPYQQKWCHGSNNIGDTA